MEVFALIDKYGLMNVLIGLVAAIMCGFLKVPIIKAVKARLLSEKETTKRIANYCMMIVIAVATAGVLGYAAYRNVWHVYDILLDITGAVAVSQILYKVYEGFYTDKDSKISLKAWMHKFWEILKAKILAEKPDKVAQLVEMAQDAVIEAITLPLTDEQKEKIKAAITKIKL